MVIHARNSPAHSKGQSKRTECFKWFAALLQTYNVKVVVGDFNMMVFETPRKCRSRGIAVDTAAWHAFKLIPGGAPAADSCAAFFVECPGTRYLLRPRGDLREMRGGILEKGLPEGYDSSRAKGDKGPPGGEAPGWPLDSYTPRSAGC
eukprot:7060971-Pyramimonas_sp.AAC.1